MDEIELRNSLVALHSASFAWAMTCCRDRELAEDLLHSVYLKVLSGKSPYQGRSSFRTWLFAVIRNAARDLKRRRWWANIVRLEFESLEQVAGTTSSVPQWFEESGITNQIRDAVDALPDRQRQIAHLVFYENMAITDAANVMGVSVGTARQHYARAKNALRSTLQNLLLETDEATLR